MFSTSNQRACPAYPGKISGIFPTRMPGSLPGMRVGKMHVVVKTVPPAGKQLRELFNSVQQIVLIGPNQAHASCQCPRPRADSIG